MGLEPHERYVVTDTMHGRFLNKNIHLGDVCEVESIGTYLGKAVAVLVFPSVMQLAKSGERIVCREYVCLDREPEKWLELAS